MRYLIILVMLMAAGCGQKGALFMPSEMPDEQAVESEETAPTQPSPVTINK